ncbi:MAG: tetratricopeptide repeat protein [Legionella sp.]|nr:tetratricopeptide repeat protein [Legionella sp.]
MSKNYSFLLYFIIQLILSHNAYTQGQQVTEVTTFSQIHELRLKGQLDKARNLAINYLQNNVEDVDVSLELGLIYYQLKKFNKASYYLNLVLAKVPTYLDARKGLVRVALAEKKYPLALYLIDEGLKQKPVEPELIALRNQTLKAQLESSKSVIAKSFIPPIPVGELKQQMIRKIENIPEMYKELQQLRKQGQITLAKEKAIDYLKIQPDDVDVMLQLGLIYLQEKEHQQAKQYFQSVLLKAPQYLDARIGLIQIAYAKKEYNTALNLVDTGLKLKQKDRKLTELKTQISNAKRESEQAVSKTSFVHSISNLVIKEKGSLSGTTKVNPEMYKELLQLRKLGQITLAKEKAISYLKIQPDDVDVMVQLGLMYLQEKEYQQAQKYFQSVLLKAPQYLDARIGLIQVAYAKKEYNTALNLIDTGLEQKQKDRKLTELKIQISNAKRESEQAVSKISFVNPISNVKENDSKSVKNNVNPEMYKELQKLRNEGQLAYAEEKALAYIKDNPNDVDVMLQLAMIYLQEKEYQKAEFYFNAVLIKTPAYLDARIGLIKIKIIEKKFEEGIDLIEKGFLLKPKDEALARLQIEINQARSSITAGVPDKRQDASLVLSEIKALREKGELNLAKNKALQHLIEFPKDVDVKLLLGLIYIQLKDPAKAEEVLNSVLQISPQYVDAREALVKIKMNKKNYKEALALVNVGLKITKNNPKLLKLKKDIMEGTLAKAKKPLSLDEKLLAKANKAMTDKNYELAHHLYKLLLLKNCNNIDALVGLANYYLAKNRDYSALHLVQRSLKQNPNSVKLIVKKGEVQQVFRRYGLASQAYLQAACLDPKDKSPKGHIKEIESISPRFLYGINEISMSSENTYVSDLDEIWDYSTVSYSRETNVGLITAKVNYAARLGEKAPQLELNFAPQLNHKAYVELVAAYANKPEIFPRYVLGAEAYVQILKKLEVSLGDRYSNIGPTYFSRYTASLNYYPKNYLLSFRPYYFVPKTSSDRMSNSKNRTITYNGVIRRYFKTIDHYVGVGAGSGLSPDLADLLTVNFIIIRINYINLNYAFPVLHHRMMIDLTTGYQHWVFPSGKVRELYSGNIGLRYRF